MRTMEALENCFRDYGFDGGLPNTESCVNYHSFYQLVGVGGREGGKQKGVSTTHSSSHLCQHPQASALGEWALVLTLAQRLVSTLERPRSMPEILRALGRERWEAVKPHTP